MSYHAYNMPPPMPVDPTDVVGKRIGAWLIDAVIFTVLIVILVNVLAPAFDVQPTMHETSMASQTAAQEACDTWNETHNGLCVPGTDSMITIEDWGGAVNLFWGIFGVLFVLFVLIQGALGASLGKRVVGLRIVKSDGSLAGIGASAIRTVLWIVDAITCAIPLVGGILIFTTKGHRRVGDMAADTYVVPASQVGHPVILPGQPGWGTYQPDAYQPMGGPGGFGQPGAPVGAPPSAPPGQSGAPTLWAPPPTDQPAAGESGQSYQSSQSSQASGDYEADKPIWDDARNAYIQYDSERAAWLEYDDAKKEWVPIST